jgi:hypothetical protein
MNVKNVGFFFEMPVQERIAAFELARRQEPHPDEEKILRYLDSGTPCAATPGVEEDILLVPPRVIGPMHIRTDGAWAWPETLAYYVRVYHILLPNDFIEDMQKNGWVCPSVDLKEPITLEGHVTM